MHVARLFRALCARHVNIHVRGHLAQIVVRYSLCFCPKHDVKLLFVVWELISRSFVLSYLQVEDLAPISLRTHCGQLVVQICCTFRQRR